LFEGCVIERSRGTPSSFTGFLLFSSKKPTDFFILTLFFVPLRKIMATNRTFQHRVTIVGVAVPIIMAVMALYFLLHRTAIHLIIGFGLVAVIIMMLERLLHTSYVFEGDMLTISRGRFMKKEQVPVKDITRISPIRRQWLLIDYLLIEYGAGHEAEVQPVNEEAFLQEIKKRQDDHEERS
jgi:membrane protein YdbS with pleckstrin-like domain